MIKIGRTVAALSLALLGCSCACLDCYRPPQTLRIRLDAPASDIYTLVSAQQGVSLTRENGRFRVDLPGKTYGYMLALFVVPIGNTDPEKKEEIAVQRNEGTVRSISVAEVRRLPKDADGTFVLKLK